MIIKLDREYEVKCTLGTIRDIEAVFKRSFADIVSGIGKLTAGEQVKMLFIGAKKADPDLTEKDFTDKCDETLGLGDLTDYLEQFILQLQYPGKTEKEIREQIEKKLQRAEAFKSSTVSNS